MEKQIRRPEETEYPAFYHTYVSKVPGNDFLTVLEDLSIRTPVLLQSLSESQWAYRYQPDKWSIKEMILHMIDAEQIFVGRALRIARNDRTPLPGFDQDPYVSASEADSRSPESLIEEYKAIRHASLTRFRSFSESMWQRIGTVSGRTQSVRAIGFILTGHELHHLGIMDQQYEISQVTPI